MSLLCVLTECMAVHYSCALKKEWHTTQNQSFWWAKKSQELGESDSEIFLASF